MLADISKFYPPTHVKTQNTFWLPWIISILICLTVQIRWYTLEDDNLYLHLRTMSHTIVPRSLVLYVCFVDRCLSFCPFSFGHCVVCCSIYGFWLPFWYLQTLRVAKFEQTTIHQHVLLRRESRSHILLWQEISHIDGASVTIILCLHVRIARHILILDMLIIFSEYWCFKTLTNA